MPLERKLQAQAAGRKPQADSRPERKHPFAADRVVLRQLKLAARRFAVAEDEPPSTSTSDCFSVGAEAPAQGASRFLLRCGSTRSRRKTQDLSGFGFWPLRFAANQGKELFFAQGGYAQLPGLLEFAARFFAYQDEVGFA